MISSSILATYRPGEFIFQCPIFLPFHTVHGVLKARILKWFAIPISSGFRKGRGTRDQISNILDHQKTREFQKNIYFCFIDYAKSFDFVDHNKLWTILKEMGISDHLTSLLRNLYAGQEATVRTGHGTTDWFQIGKGARQGCILSTCLISMQSTSCEMPDWMMHKLESRLTGEISITSDTQMTSPLWPKAKRN